MERPAVFVAMTLAVAQASCASSDVKNEDIATRRSALSLGIPDSAHTAVVALLASTDDGNFRECTGTIVQVSGDVGYVLTAAHCCSKDTEPTVLVAADDDSVGLAALSGGPISPPNYAVTSGSIFYDASYDVSDVAADFDFCMLKFSGATGMTAIPVITGNDGLAVGSAADVVGYGQTTVDLNGQTTVDPNNSLRYISSAIFGQTTAATLSFSNDPAEDGICDGDSGGPALIASGDAQASQRVVGTVSRSSAQFCGQPGANTFARVSSETGPEGFISSYLADRPFGKWVQADGTVTTVDAPRVATASSFVVRGGCSVAHDSANDHEHTEVWLVLAGLVIMMRPATGLLRRRPVRSDLRAPRRGTS
jgi:Trypsin